MSGVDTRHPVTAAESSAADQEATGHRETHIARKPITDPPVAICGSIKPGAVPRPRVNGEEPTCIVCLELIRVGIYP